MNLNARRLEPVKGQADGTPGTQDAKEDPDPAPPVAASDPANLHTQRGFFVEGDGMIGFLLRLFRPSSRRRRRPIPVSPRPRTEPGKPRPAAPQLRAGQVLEGRCHVIDGDTIVIAGTHIRLAGIDAPELDQPYGQKAKFAMIALCKGQTVRAILTEGMTYERVVAKCLLPDGTDLSAALVAQGLALDWARFSGGSYRHLEPDGVRKKLWRVDAKHKGRLTMEASQTRS